MKLPKPTCRVKFMPTRSCPWGQLDMQRERHRPAWLDTRTLQPDGVSPVCQHVWGVKWLAAQLLPKTADWTQNCLQQAATPQMFRTQQMEAQQVACVWAIAVPISPRGTSPLQWHYHHRMCHNYIDNDNNSWNVNDTYQYYSSHTYFYDDI